MSISQFTEFVKRITTENSNPARDSSGTGAVLHQALGGSLQGSPEEKIDVVSQKLSQEAQAQGFDVSQDDVKKYIASLQTQYEINPMVASMVDTYCSSSCHFGSVVSAT